jgi:hypothetical protein
VKAKAFKKFSRRRRNNPRPSGPAVTRARLPCPSRMQAKAASADACAKTRLPAEMTPVV